MSKRTSDASFKEELVNRENTKQTDTQLGRERGREEHTAPRWAAKVDMATGLERNKRSRDRERKGETYPQ